jgi:hypothetical protein
MHRLKVTESYDDAGMLYEVRSPKCQHGMACISVCDGLNECEYHLCKGDDHHYCTEDEE